MARSWREGRAPLRGKAKAEHDARRSSIQAEKSTPHIEDRSENLHVNEPQDESSVLQHSPQHTQDLNTRNDEEQSTMTSHELADTDVRGESAPSAPQAEAGNVDEGGTHTLDWAENPGITSIESRKQSTRSKQRKAVVSSKSSRHTSLKKPTIENEPVEDGFDISETTIQPTTRQNNRQSAISTLKATKKSLSKIDQGSKRTSTGEDEKFASMSDHKLTQLGVPTLITTETTTAKSIQTLAQAIPSKASNSLSKVEYKFDIFKGEPPNADEVDRKVQKRSVYKPSRKSVENFVRGISEGSTNKSSNNALFDVKDTKVERKPSSISDQRPQNEPFGASITLRSTFKNTADSKLLLDSVDFKKCNSGDVPISEHVREIEAGGIMPATTHNEACNVQSLDQDPSIMPEKFEILAAEVSQSRVRTWDPSKPLKWLWTIPSKRKNAVEPCDDIKRGRRKR